jgi:PAS domain S-box-containing protein
LARRPRILLADDNADMRAYIRSLLAHAWDIVAVSNGEDALAAAVAHPPDLVLSDVMMPKLDGFGLIARLRENERTKQVPVILLSARSGEESRIEGLRAGADDYLVKPFSAKELIARIQTHMEIGRFKAAVERERAKLSAVFAQAPVGIALLEGPDHVFAIANPVYYSMLFGGPRDFVGKTVRDAIPESVSQGFVALLDRVYNTGEPFVGDEMPIDLVQKDGTLRRFYLNFVYQPLRDANELVNGIVAVIHDVTERKEAEARVIFERTQLETIFQRSPAAMALWVGTDWVFEKVNPRYQAIFPDRRLQGRPFLDACPEFKDQPFPRLLRHVLETGEDFVGREVLARHGDSADGPPVDHYYDFTYLRINDSDGNPYGVFDHAIDVTDRVRDRQSLEEGKERLEKMVADLEQERDLRDQFVSMLSHDLRSPLQAAKMCAHLIRRKVGDSEVAQTFAVRIIENIGRADDMIRNLLDANRLKAGERLAIEIEHCELNAVAADTLADLTTLHGDRFILRADSKIEGYWSKGEIRRVLENLCGNAVKYGAPYRPVRVTLVQINDSVTIEVHNEGNPISAAGREKLFQPFKRIEGGDSSGRPAGGWGLGLTLVKGIVQAHGGCVAVQSDPGTGTVFLVTLPLDSRQLASPQSP